MIRIQDKSRCSGCRACEQLCPTGCISMVRDSEGFLYPSVDMSACIDCHVCEKHCPVMTERTPSSTFKPLSYAALCKEEEIRMRSSSGGLFSLIALAVLEKGGVVFGPAFDDSLRLRHISVTSAEELLALRGSKYVQSDTKASFREAKALLDEGRLVFYTGTPCQIGGLLAYLRRDYENLLTQDIICHGVPSPAIWEKYLLYRSACAEADVKDVSFRNKESGWKKYSMLLRFDNGKEYRVPFAEDPYMKAFLDNLILRPSCYQCAFKGMERKSDFTLGDYWGLASVHPELDDDKGVSLLFVNTQKGQRWLSLLSDSLVLQPTDAEAALRANPAMLRSVVCPCRRVRRQLFRDATDQDFSSLEKKYLRKNYRKKKRLRTLLSRIKQRLKRILGRA